MPTIANNSFYLKVADKQGHFCPVCGESIYNGEPLHLHHKIPVHQGGNDSLTGLSLATPSLPPDHTQQQIEQTEAFFYA
ncbi:MAG: HNH endonuclease [Fischerella sp. CENA71]|nr:HNH endonuclease [Fischerella sp. CENA71]